MISEPNYRLLTRGYLTDNNGSFGFYSHPDGFGLAAEFTSLVITDNFIKLLIPGGIAFHETPPFLRRLYSDLQNFETTWYLLFDFKNQNPLILVQLKTDDGESILWISLFTELKGRPRWLCKYIKNGEEEISFFKLKSWTVPDYLFDKIIVTFTSEALYGTQYC